MNQENKRKVHFRFQDLEIWQIAFRIANELFDIADMLESKKLYRFAEQLRGAGLSMTNNISEGSGSFSDKEFQLFLNYSRRSVFECANVVLTLFYRKHIEEYVQDHLLEELDHLSRKIVNFGKTLKK